MVLFMRISFVHPQSLRALVLVPKLSIDAGGSTADHSRHPAECDEADGHIRHERLEILVEQDSEEQAQACYEHYLLNRDPPGAKVGAAVLALDAKPSEGPPNRPALEAGPDVLEPAGE